MLCLLREWPPWRRRWRFVDGGTDSSRGPIRETDERHQRSVAMRGKVLSLPMPDLRFPKPCRGPLSTFIVWSLHVRGTPVGVTEKSHRRRSSAQSPGRNCAAESTQADSSRRHLVLLLVRNCLQVPWLREPEMSVVTCNFHDWTVDAVVAEDQPRRVDRKTIRRCQVDARSFGQSCALDYLVRR